MMLATPTAPTSKATAPSPRKRPSKAPWASARATRAADGWRLTQALRRPPPPDPLQPLSPRERDVLRLIAQGHSNRRIARDLAIGERTVKTHVHSILGKLGLQDRVQAAIFALRHEADSD